MAKIRFRVLQFIQFVHPFQKELHGSVTWNLRILPKAVGVTTNSGLNMRRQPLENVEQSSESL
jgi:hypothetical protein